MEEIDPLYERIDRYLRNEMTAEERSTLEQEAQSDKVLAEAMRTQVRAEYAARSYAREAKRKRLNAWLEQEATAQPTRIRSLRPYLTFAVAAAIALLILIGISIRSTQDVSSEVLYAQNMDFVPSPLTSVRGDSLDAQWESARKAYDAQDYQASIDILRKMVADTAFQSPSKAYLFMGSAYLKARGQQETPQRDLDALTDSALQAFDRISRSSEFRDDIDWYKAMAYLQARKPSQAIPLLQSIKETNRGKHVEQASALLEILMQ